TLDFSSKASAPSMRAEVIRRLSRWSRPSCEVAYQFPCFPWRNRLAGNRARIEDATAGLRSGLGPTGAWAVATGSAAGRAPDWVDDTAMQSGRPPPFHAKPDLIWS